MTTVIKAVMSNIYKDEVIGHVYVPVNVKSVVVAGDLTIEGDPVNAAEHKLSVAKKNMDYITRTTLFSAKRDGEFYIDECRYASLGESEQ